MAVTRTCPTRRGAPAAIKFGSRINWAFESLDLEPAASLGVDGLVVGYECDGCELVERDGVPQAVDASAPEGFQVLASAPARLWETREAPASPS